jgi:hypothetical protein
MDPNAIAGMAFTLVLTALVGGFILLYPVSKRLGLFLESKLQDRLPQPAPTNAAELEALRSSVLSLRAEVERLAERQDFMEQLGSGKTRDPAALPGAPTRR